MPKPWPNYFPSRVKKFLLEKILDEKMLCSSQCSTELGRFANSSEECSDIFWGTEVLFYLEGSQNLWGTLKIQLQSSIFG